MNSVFMAINILFDLAQGYAQWKYARTSMGTVER